MRLYLFSTGMIASRLSNHWQPIWVLAIDHPEGVYLVDTGIRAGAWHPFFKFRITRDQEVDRQLEKLNLKPQKIILTHRHFDHTGGLYHFPNTPVLGPYREPYPINNDISILPTPGHTKDHCSVLIKTDTFHILFGGDMCETQEQLLEAKSPANPKSRQQQTYAAVKAYAREHPLILLLTHDPGSNLRLSRLEPLPSSETGSPPPQHR